MFGTREPLSWGGFESDTSSFLCVPLIHAVLQTHGADAVFAAEALVTRYGFDWNLWVALYREDFTRRRITASFRGVGRGYIDRDVQNRLLCRPPDGESDIDPLIPGQIQLCYDLMRADSLRGLLSASPAHLSTSRTVPASSSSRAVQQSCAGSLTQAVPLTTSSHTSSSSLSSPPPLTLTQSQPIATSSLVSTSLPSSSSSSVHGASFPFSSSSSSRTRARELSWGEIKLDDDPRASYLFVPLIRAALRMDPPSAQYSVQRELDSLPGYEGAFEALVKRYRTDFQERSITSQTLSNRHQAQSDGYILPREQERLLFPPYQGGESGVEERFLFLLGGGMDALRNARRSGVI